MTKIAHSHIGRCFLHLGAVCLGCLHGHPHVKFHVLGIAREIVEFATQNS